MTYCNGFFLFISTYEIASSGEHSIYFFRHKGTRDVVQKWTAFWCNCLFLDNKNVRVVIQFWTTIKVELQSFGFGLGESCKCIQKWAATRWEIHMTLELKMNSACYPKMDSIQEDCVPIWIAQEAEKCYSEMDRYRYEV